jgi:hypothetical protein
MATLLYEIGTEEMPAQYMPGILNNYKELAETKLKEARIPFEKVSVYGTPRRMAFVAEGVADRQEDMTTESKGPSLKIAFDPNGNPTKAVEGFARGQGVEVSALKNGMAMFMPSNTHRAVKPRPCCLLYWMIFSTVCPSRRPCAGLTMTSGLSVLSTGWWPSLTVRSFLLKQTMSKAAM